MISTQAGQDEEVISANEEEDVIKTPYNKESEEPTGKTKSLNPTPRFVDSKRKNMEKKFLSKSKRPSLSQYGKTGIEIKTKHH